MALEILWQTSFVQRHLLTILDKTDEFTVAFLASNMVQLSILCAYHIIGSNVKRNLLHEQFYITFIFLLVAQ